MGQRGHDPVYRPFRETAGPPSRSSPSNTVAPTARASDKAGILEVADLRPNRRISGCADSDTGGGFLMHLEQRILVTGGSGFLGSHLCDRLVEEGANVICVDNFFSGARSNIEHLVGNKRFELMRHDVTFPLYIEVTRYSLGFSVAAGR